MKNMPKIQKTLFDVEKIENSSKKKPIKNSFKENPIGSLRLLKIRLSLEL